MSLYFAQYKHCTPNCNCRSCSAKNSNTSNNMMDRDVYIRYLEERLQRLEGIVASNTQRIIEIEQDTP